MSIKNKLQSAVLVLTIFVNIAGWCAEQAEVLPTVMGVQFGESLFETKSKISSFNLKRIDEKPGMLAYKGSLVKIDVPEKTCTYYLIIQQPYLHTKLNKITTFFDTTTLDNSAVELKDRFRRLKELITLKYGPPSFEKEFINPIFDNEDLRLIGFASQNADFICRWEAKDLIIQLQLFGEPNPDKTFGWTKYTKDELITKMKDEKEQVDFGKILFILTYEYLPLKERLEKPKELDAL